MKNQEFKVVKILDEYTVVINAGTNYNIKVNDEFQILDKKGSEVRDPETDEIIGRLDLIKANVNVTEVQEKMCICSSPHTVKVNIPLISGLDTLSSGLGFSEREKLNVELTQVTGGLRRSNAKVRIGDTVRLIKSSR
ncbi:hypothetical protein HRF87_22420 [Bacillus sp. CRN 9]|nr:hypothetical protein [Bacillus sp. CRN 9]